MRRIQKLLKRSLNVQMLKFGITGGSGFVIDMSVTWIFRDFVGINQYGAHAIGFFVAVINNYLINKYWTFRDNSKHSIRQFVFFFALSLIGMALNTIFLYIFVEYLEINFYVGKLLAVMLVFLWNYLSNSIMTFRKQEVSKTYNTITINSN
ncbi:GtrA family protein [Arcticibacter tournemirensis]|uniref:GtrA family protein n=1 Tax=Arcticibacter tournemirensis TaxID=699437 RepID=A0A4V1KIT6_9SPHI|nr:GtrA family protein [Arcticibacter tournemirensis]RXF71822.1 GtrA family protein [Arcticibacter tournemirensis]